MIFKIALLVSFFNVCFSDNDDKKWVWGQNSRNADGRSGLRFKDPDSRYNIYEPETDDYRPVDNQFISNQQYPQRPLPGYDNRPLYQNRPPVSGAGFLPDERPGGVYGGANQPFYGGQQGGYIPDGVNPGHFAGSPYDRDGPVKHIDRCKCTEKFNCNSPGISYGHCDVGKQYCCYSSKKLLGGPPPSRPVHSLANGVLVGPGGPVDSPISGYPRPPKQIGGGYYRPGGFSGGQGEYYGGRPGFGAGLREPNYYSPANGVLVGPGGPYDTPNGNPGFGLGRSAKSIKAEDAKKA